MRLISVADEDVLLSFANPAVANPQMHKQVAFHHNFLPGGIKHGVVAAGYALPRSDYVLHAGIRFLNYGRIPETDVYGNKTGLVKAGEWAFQAGVSRKLSERLRMGLNINWLSARLDMYASRAISADVGLYYADTASRVSVGIVATHLGTQVTRFGHTPKQKLPADISIGLSKRLAHLPFRFSVTAHHLNQWDLTYDDPDAGETNIIIGQAPREPTRLSRMVSNMFRHAIFSGEFLIGKYEQLRLRLGYNHLLNRDLHVENLRSWSGFTLGFGIRLKRFRFDYGFANYHFGGRAHHLAISTHF